MMDVPMIPAVLEPLGLTKQEAYRIHLRNAEQFAAMDIPIRKVFVVQGPDLEDYDRCCRDMQGLVGPKDVVAIGSIKDRAADIELIAQITALVKKHFPENDIHLFGVSTPRTVAKAAAYGATSCDSASAGLAVGLGGVLIANKTDNGWMAKKHALADLMGEPDLSIGHKLWLALTAFSMAQVEAAIAMSMVQEEAAILLEMGATDEEVVEADQAEEELAAELEELMRREEA
jgi:Queuine/archaeosine tRNA-ribosyltransferase